MIYHRVEPNNGRRSKLDIGQFKELRAGGEGKVYLDRQHARLYKIFKKDDHGKQDRLRTFVAPAFVDLAGTGKFGWPTALLQNERTGVVGYEMPFFDGFQPLEELLASDVGSANESSYLLCALLFQSIYLLHQRSVLVGDLQPKNILVRNSVNLKHGKAATLRDCLRIIDVDSFQYVSKGQQFLCDVGRPEYLSPRLLKAFHDKELERTVRSPDDDVFAALVISFQLLMGGFHPFVHIKAGRTVTARQGIEAMAFAYTRSDLNLPKNASRSAFRSLDATVRELFIKAFTTGKPPSVDICGRAFRTAAQNCPAPKTIKSRPTSTSRPQGSIHKPSQRSVPPRKRTGQKTPAPSQGSDELSTEVKVGLSIALVLAFLFALVIF